MKFHRVLLFTRIQMEITPVGEDLHVLLTSEQTPGLMCTAFSRFIEGSDPAECETTIMTAEEDPVPYLCIYTAENLCRISGKDVLCTGGICVPDLDEGRMSKLLENVDEMIHDWQTFLTD
ncbi:MAG: hypothetical protein IJH71_04850 [Eubacterium sp.]|nr:hypothetical protein [Eubacterium sp.]